MAALFASVVIVGVAVLGPVAGGRASGPAGDPGTLALPSDEINVTLRKAAVELAVVSESGDEARRTALAAVRSDAGIALALARSGAASCVEATHPRAPGEVWSYDTATGAIAPDPC